MFTGKVSRYVLVAAIALLAFFVGRNYQDVIYFDDDHAVKDAVYADAVRAFTLEENGKRAASSESSLLSERADYFRTRVLDCVRFMPIKSGQDFVLTYCKNRLTNEIEITHY